MSLLNLQPGLPNLRKLFLVPLEPDEVFSVPRVGREGVGHRDRAERLHLINIPILLLSNNQVLEPGATDLCYPVVDILDVCKLLRVLARALLTYLALVEEACEIVESGSLEHDHCLQLVLGVFKDQGALHVDESVSKEHTSKFRGRMVEGYLLPVLELNIIRALIAHVERVLTELGLQLVEAPVLVERVNVFQQKIREGRVVAGMLTEDLRPILVVSLKCFSEERIERLLHF